MAQALPQIMQKSNIRNETISTEKNATLVAYVIQLRIHSFTIGGLQRIVLNGHSF